MYNIFKRSYYKIKIINTNWFIFKIYIKNKWNVINNTDKIIIIIKYKVK